MVQKSTPKNSAIFKYPLLKLLEVILGDEVTSEEPFNKTSSMILLENFEEAIIPEGIDFLYNQFELLILLFVYSYPQATVTRPQLVELLNIHGKHKRTADRLIDKWVSKCFKEIPESSIKTKKEKRRGKPPKYFKHIGFSGKPECPFTQREIIKEKEMRENIANCVLSEFNKTKPGEVEELGYRLKKEIAFKVLPQLSLFLQSMTNENKLMKFQMDNAQTMAKKIKRLNPKHPQILERYIKPKETVLVSITIDEILDMSPIYHELREEDKLELKRRIEHAHLSGSVI